MAWMNNDGLYVKFAKEEGALVRGGEISTDNKHTVEFSVKAADTSATVAVLGGAAGSFGVPVPKGARIEAVEVITKTPFTSSGTVASATLVLGLKKASDRSTALDHTAFTTTAFVGSAIDAAGERTYLVPGVTGAGTAIGTTLAENGVVCVQNSAHGTHPFTTGEAIVRVFYFLP